MAKASVVLEIATDGHSWISAKESAKTMHEIIGRDLTNKVKLFLQI